MTAPDTASSAVAATGEVPEAAPSGRDDERLMAHAYDGIREYDNPLPGWWSMIYVGSVVFAIVYAIAHFTGWSQTPAEAYQAALAGYDSKREVRERAEAANVSEASLAKGAEDPKLLARGAALFAVRCASCHTEDGRGLIGPNLTDRFQIHGSTRMDLYHTISKGVPGTAMLAWGEQLPQPDLAALAAHAVTLRGKDVPGKAPEGAPVEAFAP